MKKKKWKDLKELWSEGEAEEKRPAEAKEKEEKPFDPELRMEEDITLFHRLFPHVTAKQIPDEVWERVEEGESLAAAFSLYTIQKMREQEAIEKVNAENESKAAPRIRHDGEDTAYFSPEAVKAMSRSEIKKNYDAILASMDKWS